MKVKKKATSTVVGNVAVTKETEEVKGVASTLLLDGVNKLVCNKFSLDESFVMTSFKEAGSQANIVLNNESYEVAVKVKDRALVELKIELEMEV